MREPEPPYKIVLSEQARSYLEKLADDAPEEIECVKKALEQIAENPDLFDQSGAESIEESRKSLQNLVGQQVLAAKYVPLRGQETDILKNEVVVVFDNQWELELYDPEFSVSFTTEALANKERPRELTEILSGYVFQGFSYDGVLLKITFKKEVQLEIVSPGWTLERLQKKGLN